MTSPVRCRTSAARRCFTSCRQRAAVRRSCHTMARCSGRPVARSHTHTVSRWLVMRSEEHTSELQSRLHLVCRLLLEKKKKKNNTLDSHMDETESEYSRAQHE